MKTLGAGAKSNFHIQPLKANSRRIIPIVLSTDANYAPYVYIVMDSLLDHLSGDCYADIIVLSMQELPPHVQQAYAALAKKHGNGSVRCVCIPESAASLLEGAHTCQWFSMATYLRLFIPQLMPKYDKVIYLDADLLIHADLGKLHAVELTGETPLAACAEGYFPVGCSHNVQLLGMAPDSEYLQAGVLAMSVVELRARGWVHKIFNVLQDSKNKKLPFLDQDILNMVFEKHWLKLPGSWNICNADLYHPECDVRNTPCPRGIIHFAGAKKPWGFGRSICLGTAAYTLWLFYAFRCPLLTWESRIDAQKAHVAELQRKLARHAALRWLVPTRKNRAYVRRCRADLQFAEWLLLKMEKVKSGEEYLEQTGLAGTQGA